jgi:hypothetical protein
MSAMTSTDTKGREEVVPTALEVAIGAVYGFSLVSCSLTGVPITLGVPL